MEVSIPKEVEEQAQMAEELHAKMFPQETPVEPKAQDEPNEPKDEPKDEPKEEPASNENSEPEEDFATKYKVLQGKYSKEVPRMANELKELKAEIERLKIAPKETKEDVKPDPAEEILANLKKEYPDELIENLRALIRLEGKQSAQEVVKPVQEKVEDTAKAQENAALEAYTNYLSSKAPNYETIWGVLGELEAGIEPSDPKIAAFLQQKDPSGLYTHAELLDMYNSKWDADRFAAVCNLYNGQQKPEPKRENPAREAMIAPSRTPSTPVTPTDGNKKMWTMAEFEQFQADERRGKYTPEQSEAIWADVQKALAENRFR